MAERVGFIGLGIMGSRMAANVARAGYELTVWNRTRATADAWAADHAGTRVATGPAELAAESDIVITMVVDGDQVEAVLLGDGGVVEGARPGTLCIDMSTISPAVTRTIGEALAAREVQMIDAPVTGSSPKAEDATLTIMVGGSGANFERARPLLSTMGELVVHVGELGQGEMLKVINNAVAAANTTAVAEALLVADATGVDLDAFVQVLSAGSGGSAMLDLKAGPLRNHDYTTLFKLDHMLKDVRLCIEQAQAAGVPFESAARTREVLTAAAGRGLGDQDFSALIEALEGFAGRRLH